MADTNDTSLTNSFYQVPSKTLGEFNITHDKIYTQTLSDDNDQLVDVNFGKLAQLSSVPVASTTDVGGIRLVTNSDGLGYQLDETNKVYPVQLTSDAEKHYENVAFVQVPWLNTICTAEQNTPHGVNYLSVGWSNEPQEVDGRLVDGGVQSLTIKVVPATLLSGIGDMVLRDTSKDETSSDYSLFNNVSAAITNPLCTEISNAIKIAADDLDEHKIQNTADFLLRDANISSISVNLKDNYYRKNETSSDAQLNSQFVGLSTNFEKYLNNQLFQGVHTNPSYLSTETSSLIELANMFASLSNTVKNGYMYKYESYLCAETSSKVELANKFATKQDNLTINREIKTDRRYTDKDIATVEAISSYVYDRLQEQTATFQGHYDNLSAVPNDKNAYPYPPPDRNDYIYVNIAADTLKMSGFNFTTKDFGVWRMKMATDQWDNVKGRQNWQPEYKISDSAFTTKQIAAMNSGITANLVALIMSYDAIKNRLTSEFPNMTTKLGQLALLDRIVNNITGTGKSNQIAMFNGTNSITGIDFAPKKEKWIFELQDGTTKVSKYILTQDA